MFKLLKPVHFEWFQIHLIQCMGNGLNCSICKYLFCWCPKEEHISILKRRLSFQILLLYTEWERKERKQDWAGKSLCIWQCEAWGLMQPAEVGQAVCWHFLPPSASNRNYTWKWGGWLVLNDKRGDVWCWTAGWICLNLCHWTHSCVWIVVDLYPMLLFFDFWISAFYFFLHSLDIFIQSDYDTLMSHIRGYFESVSFSNILQHVDCKGLGMNRQLSDP